MSFKSLSYSLIDRLKPRCCAPIHYRKALICSQTSSKKKGIPNCKQILSGWSQKASMFCALCSSSHDLKFFFIQFKLQLFYFLRTRIMKEDSTYETGNCFRYLSSQDEPWVIYLCYPHTLLFQGQGIPRLNKNVLHLSPIVQRASHE